MSSASMLSRRLLHRLLVFSRCPCIATSAGPRMRGETLTADPTSDCAPTVKLQLANMRASKITDPFVFGGSYNSACIVFIWGVYLRGAQFLEPLNMESASGIWRSPQLWVLFEQLQQSIG